MTQLILASLFFLAIHFAISGSPLRRRLVALVGEQRYLGLFSLLSLAAVTWIVFAYRGVTPEIWWETGAYAREVVGAAMIPAVLLVVLGVTTPNPTAVGGETILKAGGEGRDLSVRGIVRITRHPLMWGFALWAAAHLYANGENRAVVLFGSMFLLAALGPLLIERRRAQAAPEAWSAFRATTSYLPFAAILSGRNRLALAELGWARPAIAVVLYGALLWVHPWLSGVTILY